MNDKILFLVILLVITIKTSKSTSIQCNYNDYKYKIVGKIYICEIQSQFHIRTPETAQIENASGRHANSKSNHDVNGIWSRNHTVYYFPRGLEKFYSNLKLIFISKSGLKEIYQSDLKPFTQLKFIDFRDNHIKFIDDDLFEYNLKLEFISFANNKIHHIQPDVFMNLNSLKYLRLSKNICIDEYVDDDSINVRKLISNIIEKCFGYEYKFLNEKVRKIELATLVLNPTYFNEKVNNVYRKFLNSKFSHFKSFQKVFDNSKVLNIDNSTIQQINFDFTTELNEY